LLLPLTSLRLLALCIILSIAIPVALVILWRRAPRKPGWGLLLLVGIVLAQSTAISSVAVSVNRDYGFYPSWSSLWGTPTAPPVVVAGARLGLHAVVGTRRPILPLTSGSASDIGRYESTILKGAKSDISARVMTWLPPQYHDRQYAKTRFPVLMVLGGADVHIATVVDRLNFASVASAEIRAGRVAPFVAVFPEINVALPIETECSNYAGGPQAYTWLDTDVRKWATSTLRVIPNGSRWSVMGWSTGGYCAALLQVRDPTHFGAAASVEGYFYPMPDSTTGDLAQLLAANPVFADESNPTWLLAHHRPAHVHLLVMSSNTDPQSYGLAIDFLKREEKTPGIQPYIVDGLGHSLNTYGAVLAPILNWMTTVAGL
jgi:enterochelin esterase-like enzyme